MKRATFAIAVCLGIFSLVVLTPPSRGNVSARVETGAQPIVQSQSCEIRFDLSSRAREAIARMNERLRELVTPEEIQALLSGRAPGLAAVILARLEADPEFREAKSMLLTELGLTSRHSDVVQNRPPAAFTESGGDPIGPSTEQDCLPPAVYNGISFWDQIAPYCTYWIAGTWSFVTCTEFRPPRYYVCPKFITYIANGDCTGRCLASS